eukprot:TRINITY_DN4447_c0_g1_i1.p1 TRINITY_DN4447_c0_g1~~TRINITY_DN4447_c0_g1_i1.p1  ORF type:complete len:377 (-),score=28.02 TRINITY_DN4447_c0_g1_i1:3-1133(-)
MELVVQLCLLLSTITAAFTTPLYSEIFNQLELSSDAVGFSFSLYSFVQFIFSFFMATLITSKGYKFCYQLNFVGLLLTYFAFQYAGMSFWVLAIVQVMFGVSDQVYLISQTWVRTSVPQDQKKSEYARLMLIMSGSYIIGPSLGSVMIDWMGNKAPLFLCLVCSVALFVVRGSNFPEQKEEKTEQKINLIEFSLEPTTLRFLVGRMMASIIHSYFWYTVSTIYYEQYNLSPNEIGYTWSTIGILGLFVNYGITKFGNKYSDTTLLRFGLIASAICMLLFSQSIPLLMFTSLVPLQEFAINTVQSSVWSAYDGHVSARDMDASSKLGAFVDGVGKVIGPYLGGCILAYNYQLFHVALFGFFLSVVVLIGNNKGTHKD